MSEIFEKLGIDGEALRLAYLFGKEQGRKFLRGALIVPGLRVVDLEKIAKKNDLDSNELLKSRDLMLNSVIDFLESLAGLKG